MNWEQIQTCVGCPLWDLHQKRWRVMYGYKQEEDKKFISFTDSERWARFEENRYVVVTRNENQGYKLWSLT